MAMADTSSLSTKSMRRTAKAPVFISPRLLVERIFVQVKLVEAPGIEPGSKEETFAASTCVDCALSLAIRTPADRIPSSQFA